MIQIRSILDVADNTGAKRVSMIGVLGKKDALVAEVGDIINVNVKEAGANGVIKKGEKGKAVVVRTKAGIRRPDGSILRFDRNAIVFIDNQSNLFSVCFMTR